MGVVYATPMTTYETALARTGRRLPPPGAPNECWPWGGPRMGKGYGYTSHRIDGKVTRIYVHRAAWELARGPIPEGMTVHHRCGAKLCTNPAHLALLTIKENALLGKPCLDNRCTCSCHGLPS